MKRFLSISVLIFTLGIPAALSAMQPVMKDEDKKTSAASMLQLQKHAEREAQEHEHKQAVDDAVVVHTPEQEQQRHADFNYCLFGNLDEQGAVKRHAGLPDVLANLVGQYSAILPEDAEYTVKHILEGHDYSAVAISQDGSHIVTGSQDGTIRFWNANTGAWLWAIKKAHAKGIKSVAISHDSFHIISTSDDGTTTKLWGDSGVCLGTWKNVVTAAFNHNGTSQSACATVGDIGIWDIHAQKLLRTLAAGNANLVAFNHDGSRIVTTHDDNIKIWDAHTGVCLHTLAADDDRDYFVSVSFNHDGSRVVSETRGSSVYIWDAHTGTCLHIFDDEYNGRFNHDGSRIFSTPDGTAAIKIRDAHTGDVLRTVQTGHAAHVSSLALSRDGSRMVSVADDGIKVWDFTHNLCPLIKCAKKAHKAGLQQQGVRRVLDAAPEQVDVIIKREKRKEKVTQWLHSDAGLQPELLALLRAAQQDQPQHIAQEEPAGKGKKRKQLGE